MSAEYVWGNLDDLGARACNKDGCTVRVWNAFRYWQRRKGLKWNPTHRELIPDCAGGPVPVSRQGSSAKVTG